MGTFAILFIIGCFIAGMMSRTKPIIVINDRNRHLFTNSKNSNLSKETLKEKINLEYDRENFKEVDKLCLHYFHNFSWDSELLYLLILALISEKRFKDANRYANILTYDLNEYGLGYFLKGTIEFVKGDLSGARKNYQKAVENGIPNEDISDITENEIFIM